MRADADRLVLDTCIVVHWLRGNEIGQRIDARFGLRSGLPTTLLSAVTVGEARSLALQWSWPAPRVARLQKLISELIVLPIDTEPIVERYAAIDKHSRDVGRKMGKNDLWIAATAAAFRATIITTDRDFQHLDPAIVSHIWINPDGSAPT
jgi:tRNA(fMet)-specific endonuclease VapC